MNKKHQASAVAEVDVNNLHGDGNAFKKAGVK